MSGQLNAYDLGAYPCGAAITKTEVICLACWFSSPDLCPCCGNYGGGGQHTHRHPYYTPASPAWPGWDAIGRINVRDFGHER